MTTIFDQFDLRGRVILITGGAGLLGREYAPAMAQAGAHVIVADLDGDAAATVAAAVTDSSGNQALGLAVDVTNKDSVQAAVQQVRSTFGRIDGLVNNAALNPKIEGGGAMEHVNTFEDFPLELWNQSLAVNMTGMFLCAQAVAPAMLEGGGAIVNISSTYGVVAPDQSLYAHDDPDRPRTIKPVTYAVTKSAVLGLTRYLAAYWGEQKIRVNTLTPGGVLNGQDDDFVQRYSARTILGRMADRHEYCGALLFLLSDASSYMTGSNLIVDGGWTAW